MARILFQSSVFLFGWVVLLSSVRGDTAGSARILAPRSETASWEEAIGELPELPAPSEPDQERPVAPPEERPAERRDPTEPGEELRDLVAPLRLGQPGRAGAAAGLTVPRMVLKGRIVGPSAPPAILLELDESLYVLHEDSELTVEEPGGGIGGVTLQVQRIDASEVRIEVLPFRKIMILR